MTWMGEPEGGGGGDGRREKAMRGKGRRREEDKGERKNKEEGDYENEGEKVYRTQTSCRPTEIKQKVGTSHIHRHIIMTKERKG